MTDLAKELIRYDDDMRRMIRKARRMVSSDAPLASVIGRRQMSGGKRLRAVITLICARTCGLPQTTADKIAIAIEIIHAATLLHDDVVDDASLRRRRSTANHLYGNAAAVLGGDFLYSRASQILSEIGSLPLLSWIARATNGLAEGEILQLQQRGKVTNERAYFDIIRRKTGNLFESAAAAAPLVAQNDEFLPALAEYGLNLGMAFQVIDDCLDYAGNDSKTGKKIGVDFAEGKMTLPVILALAAAPASEKRRVLAGWRRNNETSFADTLRLVRDTGALAETRRRASDYAKRAENALTAIPARHRPPLTALVRASLRRQS